MFGVFSALFEGTLERQVRKRSFDVSVQQKLQQLLLGWGNTAFRSLEIPMALIYSEFWYQSSGLGQTRIEKTQVTIKRWSI